jgi:hypothetical protein
MIASLDAHIVARLARVTVKTGSAAAAPVKVYPIDGDRAKGLTIFPCYALCRTTPFKVNTARTKTMVDYMTSGTAASTDTILSYNDVETPETDTGVMEYTSRDWPTVINLFYQVDIFATNTGHATDLLTMLFEAIPYRYTAKISDKHMYFSLDGTTNLDKLAAPLFRTAVRYRVEEVPLHHLATKTISGIKDIVMTGNLEA